MCSLFYSDVPPVLLCSTLFHCVLLCLLVLLCFALSVTLVLGYNLQVWALSWDPLATMGVFVSVAFCLRCSRSLAHCVLWTVLSSWCTAFWCIVPPDALFCDALGNDQSLVQLCGILFPSKSNHWDWFAPICQICLARRLFQAFHGSTGAYTAHQALPWIAVTLHTQCCDILTQDYNILTQD